MKLRDGDTIDVREFEKRRFMLFRNRGGMLEGVGDQHTHFLFQVFLQAVLSTGELRAWFGAQLPSTPGDGAGAPQTRNDEMLQARAILKESPKPTPATATPAPTAMARIRSSVRDHNNLQPNARV